MIMRKFFYIKTQCLIWLLLVLNLAYAREDELYKKLESEKKKTGKPDWHG